MTDTPTALQDLLSEKLGRWVLDWIGDQRNAGDSWRAISYTLWEATNIDVAPETLRVWMFTAKPRGEAND